MNIVQKETLIQYFFSFITQHKKDLMQRALNNRTRHITVVMEDVFQPHNISAAIRSAECFGVQDVHIIEQRHAFIPEISVSRGSSNWVTLEHYHGAENNTKTCFDTLRAQGYTIVATSPHATAYTISEFPLDKKVALVFGTEDVGISDYVKEQADASVVIPMYGFTESFNISVSVALCLYDMTTRLRTSSINWALSEDEKLDIQLDWLRATIRGSSLLEQRFLESQEHSGI